MHDEQFFCKIALLGPNMYAINIYSTVIQAYTFKGACEL